MNVVRRAVAREALQMNNELETLSENLQAVLNMLPKAMLIHLREKGRKNSSKALKFWKDFKARKPLPDQVHLARSQTFISSKASLETSKRLIRDLGKLESNQSQSFLTETLEMTERIRFLV